MHRHVQALFCGGQPLQDPPLYFSTVNPLPSGTLATFFLTAIGQIKHTEEGDISREKDDSDDVTAAREGRRR
jgi:hypothetical protein